MISAIVCVDKNWSIGYQGKLLANIPEDMKFFKEKTIGSIVIMGRKTYDSLPIRPLPNRINIVITSKTDSIEYNRNDNYYIASMDFVKNEILSDAHFRECFDMFVIGGGTIYKELLPYCDNAYVTKVDYAYENTDTYFPNLDKKENWEMTEDGKEKMHDGIGYKFCTYNKHHSKEV